MYNMWSHQAKFSSCMQEFKLGNQHKAFNSTLSSYQIVKDLEWDFKISLEAP